MLTVRRQDGGTPLAESLSKVPIGWWDLLEVEGLRTLYSMCRFREGGSVGDIWVPSPGYSSPTRGHEGLAAVAMGSPR